MGRREAIDRRGGSEARRLDADDAPVIGARRHQLRLGGMLGRLAGGQLRFGLGDVGRGDLAGVEAVARIGQRALQDADIILLHLQVRGVARHVHVDRRRRQQHRGFHHSQRLARCRNLALGGADLVAGLPAVEQGLRAGEPDRARRA